MKDRSRVFALILIMLVVALGVCAAALYTMHQTEFKEHHDTLRETAQSRARIIESIAEFSARYEVEAIPEGAFAATLEQIRKAHDNFEGFGETGEFTLAHREGDEIVFLLSHRHYDTDNPKPVPFSSKYAEPMRRALSGQSGTVIGLDYRGTRVLAAYEPVGVFGLGVVAKVDLSEILWPHIRASLYTAGVAFVLISIGVFLFLRVSNPIIGKLRDNARKLEAEIVERKIAESSYKEAGDQLRTVINAVGEAIISIGEDGLVMEFNSAAEKMFGQSREGMIGQQLDCLMPEEFRSKHQGYVESFFKTGKPNAAIGKIIELPGLRSDGTVFPMEISLSTGKIGEGRIVISVVRDITERKQAEEKTMAAYQELQAKEQALRLTRQAMDYAGDGLFWLSPDGHFYDVNETACRRLGYAREELLEMTVHDIDPCFPAEAWPAHWLELREKRQMSFESIHLTREGQEIPVEIAISYYESEGQEYNFAYARDITERKRLEKERKRLEQKIRQAQKLESIGVLAGGIAHDFNNILYAILGYADLITPSSEDDKSRGYLAELKKAGYRAKDLVSQILAFSRQVEPELKVLQIQAVLEETVALLRKTIPADIEILMQIDSNCGAVLGDEMHIHQVFMNICTNAYQAIGHHGGTIEVSLREEHVTLELADRYVEMKPGEYVCATVTDTGCGISEEALHRIFDPFFTTKGIGEGTGLGLSTAHGIVKKHGGTIAAQSGPGKGTTFKIYFPIYNSKDAPIAEASEEGAILLGNEHVLFVDDESPIAEVGKGMLENLGYQVTTRTSSEEALEVFRSDPENFDIVITDQAMPNMTGIQLSRELIKIRTDIPIVLCTGYSDVISREQALEMDIREYVVKPASGTELSRIIRKVLGQTEGKKTEKVDATDPHS